MNDVVLASRGLPDDRQVPTARRHLSRLMPRRAARRARHCRLLTSFSAPHDVGGGGGGGGGRKSTDGPLSVWGHRRVVAVCRGTAFRWPERRIDDIADRPDRSVGIDFRTGRPKNRTRRRRREPFRRLAIDRWRPTPSIALELLLRSLCLFVSPTGPRRGAARRNQKKRN